MAKNKTIKPTPNFSVSSNTIKPEKKKVRSEQEDTHIIVDVSRINEEMNRFTKPVFKSITGICKHGVPELWRIELEEG